MAVSRERFVLFGIVTLAVALLLALVPATPAQARDSRSVGRIQTIVENKINAARERNGLKPLKVNARLERWAGDHADYMADRRTLVHDSLTRLMLEAPLTARKVSENIARNTHSNAARRAHEMFMQSDGHRANILDRSATHMGIGVVKRGDYTYIVQRFATLRG